MKVKVEEKYQAAIIELSGNLVGGENAELFRKKLYELIEQKKKNIVVNMTNVKMVNSTGIGILISGFTSLKNAGGDLKLAHISDNVKGVLSITKLNQVFHVYSGVDEALKAFN
jgi:anti-sigma B factor antagonist